MGKIVMPKNSALLNEIEAVLKIYYEADGWLSNDEYKSKLKQMIGADQYESSYTKKAQITSYFGFTESQDIHTKRITKSGREMYKAIQANDTAKIQEVLMYALENTKFGRNNDGCPDCNSDVEPPVLFIRASLDLGYLTYKEFAYLLWKLEDVGANYTDSLSEIRKFRTSGLVELGEEAQKYTDAKPIMILIRWGFLAEDDDSTGGKHIIVRKEVKDRFEKRLKNLKIYNIDKNIPIEDKMSLAQVAEVVEDATLIDYSSEYEYFKANYSLDVLKGLSDQDLAKRLFASKEYANVQGIARGFAIWAEHGNGSSNPFGKAKSHTGGQGGVVLKADGTYHIYAYGWEEDPATGKKKKRCNESVLEEDDALLIALMIRDSFSRIADYISSKTFSSKADYEALLEKVKEILKSADDDRLYWKADGDPDPIVMKYLHCSFPDVFGCCYSKDKTKRLLLPVYDEKDLSDNALVLNGQLSLLAASLPIEVDNANFGVIWWNYVMGQEDKAPETIVPVDEEDEEDMAADNERKFREWFANQTTATGKKCTPSMISNNCIALKNVCKMMDIVEFPELESIFEITDIDQFCEVRDIIKGHDDYNEVNKACNNRYLSSGLKWYEKYLNETSVETVTEESPEEYTKANFLSEVFMDSDRYDELVKLLKYKKNIILQGAPGVGKTFLAKRLAYSIIGKKSKKQVETIQFHQSYSYEDFIMGYKPVDDGFELQKGVFYRFCKKAEADPDNDYFFIIDEINRGNLSKIFGELLMLVEGDKRGPENAMKLAYKDEYFFVPPRVYIIGMMNTADRSLAMMDYALRRRFSFFEVEPAFGNAAFTKHVEDITGSKDIAKKVNKKFKQLNEKIADEDTSGLGKGFCIGHSYFCVPPVAGQTADEWYKAIVNYEISPLLDEYWWDDKNKAKDCREELLND